MSYTRHTWVDGETITDAKLNNIEDGIEEAAQSGGGYDIVIESYAYVDPAGTMSVSSFVVNSGSPLDLEDKADNGEPASGLLILHMDWSWTPTGANTNKRVFYLPLTELNCPYTYMTFGALCMDSLSNGAYVTPMVVTFTYDGSDGSLSRVYSTFAPLAFD